MGIDRIVKQVDFLVCIVRTDLSGDDSPFLGGGVLGSANQVLICRQIIKLSTPVGGILLLSCR